jgi:flavin-dependent dehydrogenase
VSAYPNALPPRMQETVLGSARNAGAEVWRGATVSGLRAEDPPGVFIERDGRVIELIAQLVVCADGRNSAARSWAGFATKRGSQKLLGAGLLLENLSVAEDASHVMLNPFDVRWALVIPLGGGRARAYLFYGTDLERLQGERDTTRFIDACVRNAGGNVRECAAHRFPMGVGTVEKAALRRRKNQASLNARQISGSQRSSLEMSRDLRISPTRNRSVSRARRWIEALRLSTNCEPMEG